MSHYYTAKWSARTRGARWRTVTGESLGTITASSLRVACAKAAKFAERDHKLAAITLTVTETGTVAPLRCVDCGKSKQGGAHFTVFAAFAHDGRAAGERYEPEGFHKWRPNR